ncbi:Tat pathway signal sequence domain protein [Streptomyces sp. PSKA28]|uniref:Tat pathway signal sequence domain protein n=1 Tax=Streptomyces himalayensis subsp. himalayensis TaxID=2756131 RepID=A0A7W0I9X2_9ACTN|nr:Tat pathway signal sequence domain protein [Streptomyces himalayensis subsp. himalayensis]
MRELARRHLGKVVAGAAIAVAGTALMVAVTLPGEAGAGEPADRRTSAGAAQQDAVPPEGIVETAPTEADQGVGSDPLTDDELKRAERIAETRALRSDARDVDGDRGPQRLSTNLSEPAPDDTAPQRRADVVFYDYKTDAVITKTVNLTTGKVEQTDVAHGVQPPPSQEELREAAQLLIADPLGADLKNDYRHATDKELSGPAQLELSGMIFRKETFRQVPSGLADCGEHRCLRVVAKVRNGPWIDTRSLVVDLSARTVSRLG